MCQSQSLFLHYYVFVHLLLHQHTESNVDKTILQCWHKIASWCHRGLQYQINHNIHLGWNLTPYPTLLFALKKIHIRQYTNHTIHQPCNTQNLKILTWNGKLRSKYSNYRSNISNELESCFWLPVMQFQCSPSFSRLRSLPTLERNTCHTSC